MSSAVGAVLVLASVLAAVQGIVLTDTLGNRTQLGSNGPLQPQATNSYWPAITSLIRSSWAMVEGRGKKGDKGYGAMMMMGSMFLMMGLTALAALSGKALAASMAALLLAAMALMKKSSQGSGHHSYEVVSIPHGHHHRSLAETTAEALATAYGYEASAESIPPTTTTQIHNNRHMSAR